MEQEKQNTYPKKRFFKSMLIGSGIMAAISEIERISSSSNAGRYTATWLATILCLLLAGNEYIGLARMNAKKYNKEHFETLLSDALYNQGNKKATKIVEQYFIELLKADKEILLTDFDLIINYLDKETTETEGNNLKNKELYMQLLQKFNRIVKISFI